MSLDKIDIKRVQSYIEQINKDLKPYQNAFFDEQTQTQLRETVKRMLENIKSDTNLENVKLKSERNGHDLQYTLEIPIWYFEGHSAESLRNMGMNIGNDIPDCAVLKNGKFEWVHLDFTIKKGFEPLPEGGNY